MGARDIQPMASPLRRTQISRLPERCGPQNTLRRHLMFPLPRLPPPDLEHVLRGQIPDPPHGSFLHLHRIHLQRLLLQVLQHLRLVVEGPAHVHQRLLDVRAPPPLIFGYIVDVHRHISFSVFLAILYYTRNSTYHWTPRSPASFLGIRTRLGLTR